MDRNTDRRMAFPQPGRLQRTQDTDARAEKSSRHGVVLDWPEGAGEESREQCAGLNTVSNGDNAGVARGVDTDDEKDDDGTDDGVYQLGGDVSAEKRAHTADCPPGEESKHVPSCWCAGGCDGVLRSLRGDDVDHKIPRAGVICQLQAAALGIAAFLGQAGDGAPGRRHRG